MQVFVGLIAQTCAVHAVGLHITPHAHILGDFEKNILTLVKEVATPEALQKLAVQARKFGAISRDSWDDVKKELSDKEQQFGLESEIREKEACI